MDKKLCGLQFSGSDKFFESNDGCQVGSGIGDFNWILRIQKKCKKSLQRTQKSISSVAYQRRRKRSIKFFFQSCIQDWISAVDAANNAASTKYCENQSCIMLISMSVDVVVFGVDG